MSDVQRARWAVAVTFGLHGAVMGSFATRIPWIAQRLDTSPGSLGFALAFGALGAMTAMPFAGRVTHRYRSRTVVRVLMVAWCLALVPPALAPNLALLCAAMFAYGATSGMADVAMNAQGVAVENAAGRSIMSSLHGMWSLGGLVGSGIGLAAAKIGLDATIHFAVVAAVFAVAATVIGGFLLDVSPPEGENVPAFALPPRSVLLIALVGFAAVFAEGASADWSAVYLTDVARAGPAVAAAAFSGFAATMAAARMVGDRVVDRFGPVRTVRVGGLVATLGSLTVAASRAPVMAIAGFALIGLGIAVVVPLAFTAAGNAGPRPGQQIAGVATIAYGAGLIAPASIGGIAQATSLSFSFLSSPDCPRSSSSARLPCAGPRLPRRLLPAPRIVRLRTAGTANEAWASQTCGQFSIYRYGPGIDNSAVAPTESTPTLACPCPRCGLAMTIGLEDEPWCPACEWNLDALPPPRAYRGWVFRPFDRLDHRVGFRADEAVASGSLRDIVRPRLRLGQLVLVLFSAAVAVLMLALLAGALWLTVVNGTRGLLMAVAPVTLAVVMRPRLRRFSHLARRAFRLTPAQGPALHVLIDQIAAGPAPRPDVVLVTRQPDVSTAIVGLRHQGPPARSTTPHCPGSAGVGGRDRPALGRSSRANAAGGGEPSWEDEFFRSCPRRAAHGRGRRHAGHPDVSDLRCSGSSPERSSGPRSGPRIWPCAPWTRGSSRWACGRTWPDPRVGHAGHSGRAERAGAVAVLRRYGQWHRPGRCRAARVAAANPERPANPPADLDSCGSSPNRLEASVAGTAARARSPV